MKKQWVILFILIRHNRLEQMAWRWIMCQPILESMLQKMRYFTYQHTRTFQHPHALRVPTQCTPHTHSPPPYTHLTQHIPPCILHFYSTPDALQPHHTHDISNDNCHSNMLPWYGICSVTSYLGHVYMDYTITTGISKI